MFGFLRRKATPTYPSPATWKHASERQANRALRSFNELKKRCVPVFQGPLCVADDGEVTIQSPQEVARRALVLWAVELRAEGVPQEETLQLINQQFLWDSVSPKEKLFLNEGNPDPEQCRRLVWRLEAIWVLLWALGYVEDLKWPSGMCDVPKLAGLISSHEDDPNFIAKAHLRTTAEILDAQDLMMRTHWAVRDAMLHRGGTIPEGLDWSGKSEFIPVTMSAAVGVVEERHYVLNWLVNYLAPKDWDSVDTPT